MKTSYYIIACLLLLSTTLHATTRKVLFIGNSYTYSNSMPSMLQSFAAAKGDTLIFDQSDPGGYTFQQHCSYQPTISLIFSQKWDIVVLQEQSELPAFPPLEVDTEVYPYAHMLDSMIHANDSCTQTMFMMTWGHAAGDPANCSFYPPICTYAGMQSSLRSSYMQMTQDNNAIVAPVGAAWKMTRDSFPNLWLYQADSIHPNVSGSYLQTCVLYASIFHKQTSGCTYLNGLSVSDAGILQHIADKVTMDSLTQWQQYGHYPYAGFTYMISGNSVTFTGHDPITSSQNWLYGDATNDTTGNPSHTYGNTSNYIVSHTVSNACFTETQNDTINISTSGINNIENNQQSPIQIAQNNKREITFISKVNDAYDCLDVYGIDGRKAGHFLFNSNKIIIQLMPGAYIYSAYSQQKKNIITGKFVVFK